MTDCRRIESLLPPYVDGQASPETVALVEEHLAECALCRAEVAAQQGVRIVLRARADDLRPIAPPGLRTRVAARLAPDAVTSLGWRGRLTAFGAAAVVVLLVITGLEFVSPRSSVLFAAQLALDHVRCFIVEMGSLSGVDAAEVRQQFAQKYGWDVTVPESSADAGLTLIAARRCPFWIGDYAHLLYRVGDRHLSLYITPQADRPRAELSVLGHAERIWTHKNHAYVLVARGVAAGDLDRLASYLEDKSRAE
jgi:anti-sigma factor RsiW